MRVKLPRRNDDYEVDPWDFWQSSCSLPTGSLHQVSERSTKSRKKVKRRPIGFLADIDQLIDAD